MATSTVTWASWVDESQRSVGVMTQGEPVAMSAQEHTPTHLLCPKGKLASKYFYDRIDEIHSKATEKAIKRKKNPDTY